jgi:membrane protein implicated in regulation of membrane protease activity
VTGTIRPYYDAVIAVTFMTVFASVAGLIAAVIAGGSASVPVAAIVFLITGAALLFQLWRKSRTSAIPSADLP